MNDSQKLHKAASECLEEAFRTHKCPLCQGTLVKPDEEDTKGMVALMTYPTEMEELWCDDPTCEMVWMRPKPIPCKQCEGRGSHPKFTRQICDRCHGSRVEPKEAD